jgi:hypothetical protein
MEYTHTGTGGPSDAMNAPIYYAWNGGSGLNNPGIRIAGMAADPDPWEFPNGMCDMQGEHVHVEQIPVSTGATYYANNPNGTDNDPFRNADSGTKGYSNWEWSHFVGFMK